MTLKSSRCSKDIYRKIVDPSLSLGLPPVEGVRSIPSSEDDYHLYKRRKMDEECSFLLTKGNTEKRKTRSFFEDKSFLVRNGDGKSLTVSPNIEVSNSIANTVGYKTECKENAEGSKGNILRRSSRSHSNVDYKWPSSISSMPSYVNHKNNYAWNCSTSDTNASATARKLCISIIKGDIFPIKGSEPSSTSTIIAPDYNDINPLLTCKSCGSLEDPSNMLICDCCEGAFHLSCCYDSAKKIPTKEWYCSSCSRKKPKRQREKLSSSHDGSPKHIQRPRRGFGPIGDMLVDTGPYEGDARIGRDFQAIVPEWSGPISGAFRVVRTRYLALVTGFNAEKSLTQVPFVASGGGHHCLLFNQAIGIVHVQFFGIHFMLIVLFRRNWRLMKFLSN